MSRSVGNTPDVTSLQGGTAGQVAYQSAPSTTAFAGPGTSGQVLTSNGASAPTFQTVSAGAVSPTYQVFTSGSGTYTPPSGVSYLIVEMCGGGGGGGKNSATYASGGGGSGAYLKVKFPVGTYSYSVGTGGTGSNTAGNNGAPGTNTTFSTLSANAGAGGPYYESGDPANGGGYVATGASLVLLAIQGTSGSVGSNLVTSPGAASFWGQASYAKSAGSTSVAPRSYNYGAGGGGVNAANFAGPAGDGSPGRIIVTEYY
jgi:hypothetical protein